MNRVSGRGYRERIGYAIEVLPPRIAGRVAGTHFLCGANPNFVGLHRHTTTVDGRALSATAHCSWAHLQRHLPAERRATTIVLPVVCSWAVIVHELGHALHERIGWTHDAAPVTVYARTNRFEAFAEAFTTWLLHGYGDYDALRADEPTVALLEGLAA